MDTITSPSFYEYALKRLEDSPLHKVVAVKPQEPTANVSLQFSDSLSFDDSTKGQ